MFNSFPEYTRHKRYVITPVQISHFMQGKYSADHIKFALQPGTDRLESKQIEEIREATTDIVNFFERGFERESDQEERDLLTEI